jgi:acid phosphatase class B
LLGKDPGPEVEIHHQDFDSRNCCPLNLMILDYDIHQAFENSSRRQMIKGIKGFQPRPKSDSAEIDWLVVDMLWADMQNRGDKWSPTEALARRDREINPKRGQQGLFD